MAATANISSSIKKTPTAMRMNRVLFSLNKDAIVWLVVMVQSCRLGGNNHEQRRRAAEGYFVTGAMYHRPGNVFKL
jgi:predicted Zn-dependent protease